MAQIETVILAFCAGICVGIGIMALWLWAENRKWEWHENDERWWEDDRT